MAEYPSRRMSRSSVGDLKGVWEEDGSDSSELANRLMVIHNRLETVIRLATATKFGEVRPSNAHKDIAKELQDIGDSLLAIQDEELETQILVGTAVDTSGAELVRIDYECRDPERKSIHPSLAFAVSAGGLERLTGAEHLSEVTADGVEDAGVDAILTVATGMKKDVLSVIGGSMCETL